MKKIILFVVFVITNLSYSQTTCPDSIKSNSTPEEPTFVLNNGQNGCDNNTWPTSILVDGLTYSFVSCSGGNLKYIIDSGQTPPTGFDVTVDYGNGLVCSYDTNGQLDNTLSSEGYSFEESVSIFPNPISKGENLTIKLPKKDTYTISIINILGKTIFNQQFSNSEIVTIDTTSFTNGLYIINLKGSNKTLNKKFVLQN